MKKGFTLIELLVVVLIIGILSAVALPQYEQAVRKSRYTQLQTVAKTLAEAQDVYKLAVGDFSNTFDKLDVSLPANAQESADGSVATMGKFRFDIWVNESRTNGCITGSVDSVSYLHCFGSSLGTHIRQCRVRKGVAKDAALCKSMGGVLFSGSAAQDWYDLP